MGSTDCVSRTSVPRVSWTSMEVTGSVNRVGSRKGVSLRREILQERFLRVGTGLIKKLDVERTPTHNVSPARLPKT